MQLFIDYVEPTGVYRRAKATCTIDPGLPLGVLTAVVFLNAVGQQAQAESPRVFHVEGNRFLSAFTLADCAVDERDTLVVVNTDDPDIRAAQLVQRWWARGGAHRRCGTNPLAQAGVMH